MIKKGKGEGGRRKRYPLKTGMVVLGKTEKGRGKKTKDTAQRYTWMPFKKMELPYSIDYRLLLVKENLD